MWKDSIAIIEPGCYSTSGELIPGREADLETIWKSITFQSEEICYTLPVQRTFLALLVFLQVITLLWLYMILRIAWRVVRGIGADDTRSEDEDELDDELEELKKR